MSPTRQRPFPDIPVMESSPTTPDVLPPAPPSTARRVFSGPYGLRAGWSLLVYVAILAVLIGGLRLAGHYYRVAHPKSPATAGIAEAAAPVATSPAVRDTAAALPTGAAATAAAPTASTPTPTPTPMRDMIIGEGVAFLVMLLVTWIMAGIERRRLSAYGLGGEQRVARFVVGGVWGLLAMSTLIATLRMSHLLVFDTQLDHGTAILGWGATQLVAFLLVGLVEEYLFRGYIQFTLTRGLVSIGNRVAPAHARTIGFWIAAFLTSALFLVAHTQNNGETALGLFQVFLAGVVFIVALWRTGSLWWAIGFHTTWDWAQSFLYGVPDSGGLMQGRLFATHAIGNPLYSGGTVGPEGSVLCVPILIMVIVILRFTRPSPQPPLEATRAESPVASTEPVPSHVPAIA
jgi:membrane protease YdiL (CAAX protease family)